MPYLNSQIQTRGPLVNLKVEVSAPRALALRSAGQPVPPPTQLRGLIDTGADVTLVDTRHLPFLVQQNPVITLVGSPAGGWTIGLQYDVSLTVLHPQGGRQSHRLVSTCP